MERMVKNRLYHLAEERGMLCDEQAGFRRCRSTEDQVLRMSQDISDGFQRPKSERTVVALLDYSKAYDTVWRWNLIKSLMDKAVPTRFVRWIAGFLRNRQACLRLDGEVGAKRRLTQGVPQGSVLSPLLFLFYINGVRDVVNPEVGLSLYADDLKTSKSHNDRVQAALQVEEAVNGIAKWSREAKLTLNAAKCEVAFFSMNTNEADWEPTVVMDGQRLKVNKNPTFLGVTYDRSLSFNKQVDKVVEGVNRRCRMLSAVAHKDWGWRTELLRKLFITCVRSGMDYAGAAWQPWLSETAMGRLERAQNKALRLVTGQLKSTPVEALRLEAMVPSYATLSKRNSCIAYEKSLRLPDNNPRRTVARNTVQDKLKRNNWRRSARKQCEDLFSVNVVRQPIGHLTSPPWERGAPENLDIWTSLAGGSTKKTEQSKLQEDASQTVRSRQVGGNVVTIYTDGSATAGNRLGGGAAVVTSGPPDDPQVIQVIHKRGRLATSSFEAEASAMQLAINFIADYQGPETRFIVCSDSQSLLTALGKEADSEALDVSVVRSALKQVCKRRKVSLQWVPGHCGLKGNELVDQEAKAACSMGSPDESITFATAKALIKEKVVDALTNHELLKIAYGKKPSRIAHNRREAVLMAQIRTGHCALFAAYRHSLNPDVDPLCKRCGGPVEDTMQHWLTECPALDSHRFACFGSFRTDLEVLASSQEAVAAYTRRTLVPR
jgi:ribonuclease HI